MSSVTRVPQTCLMAEADLSAEDARETLRHYGSWHLVRDAFIRFRYGDGFSHARALGLQLTLAVIPLGIAFVGLTGVLHAESIRETLREVLLRITPGTSDEVVRRTLDQGVQSGTGSTVALWAGLAIALYALTLAMGQVERGANRIYGIQRDRPALQKYTRATALALTAGLMSLVGFLVIVGGGAAGTVLARRFGWSDLGQGVWSAARFPLGILLALAAITLMIERSPRRRQPGWSWIAIGAGVALTLWVLFTYLLSVYVQTSGSFGSTYGPLTGIIALLLWANLTSLALFLGIAFCAQLEAVRAGVTQPEPGDPEADRL